MTRAPKYEVPTSFREVPVEMVLGFVRARPLCTLVASLPGGGLHAGHLPVVLERRADGVLALRGHVSRANAGWRALEGEVQAVAILAEQEAYAVPEAAREQAVAERGSEPFAAVHLHGRMRII